MTFIAPRSREYHPHGHLQKEAIACLDPQQELFHRKDHGGELLLKLARTRLSLGRMKLSPIEILADVKFD